MADTPKRPAQGAARSTGDDQPGTDAVGAAGTTDDLVVLLDADGRPCGTMPKLDAHRAPGHLHRAVSLCLFDARGRVLLQQRADAKYHFAGRWSNSCCTHPRPDEDPAEAVIRRTYEELGIEVRGLVECGTFVYQATDPGSGLVEWELDHVFAAMPVGRAVPHPDEVSAVRWAEVDDALVEASASPRCTPWLGQVLELACSRWLPNPGVSRSVA